MLFLFSSLPPAPSRFLPMADASCFLLLAPCKIFTPLSLISFSLHFFIFSSFFIADASIYFRQP
jgi:hypothetical protein